MQVFTAVGYPKCGQNHLGKDKKNLNHLRNGGETEQLGQETIPLVMEMDKPGFLWVGMWEWM